MTDIMNLLRAESTEMVIVGLTICACIILFRDRQKEKVSLQETLERYRAERDARIEELELFQRNELLEINKTLIKTLEQNNRCMQDSTNAATKLTEIIILQRAKEQQT